MPGSGHPRTVGGDPKTLGSGTRGPTYHSLGQGVVEVCLPGSRINCESPYAAMVPVPCPWARHGAVFYAWVGAREPWEWSPKNLPPPPWTRGGGGLASGSGPKNRGAGGPRTPLPALGQGGGCDLPGSGPKDRGSGPEDRAEGAQGPWAPTRKPRPSRAEAVP